MRLERRRSAPQDWMRTVVIAVAVLGLAAGEACAQDRWFGRDKALHFAAGAAFGIAGYSLASLASGSRGPRIAVGLTLGIGAGAAKEWRDWRSRGRASWRDFTWTAGGAGLGVTTAWLVDRHRGATTPAF